MNEIAVWAIVIAIVSIGIPALNVFGKILDELRRVRSILESISAQRSN